MRRPPPVCCGPFCVSARPPVHVVAFFVARKTERRVPLRSAARFVITPAGVERHPVVADHPDAQGLRAPAVAEGCLGGAEPRAAEALAAPRPDLRTVAALIRWRGTPRPAPVELLVYDSWKLGEVEAQVAEVKQAQLPPRGDRPAATIVVLLDGVHGRGVRQAQRPQARAAARTYVTRRVCSQQQKREGTGAAWRGTLICS